MKPHDEVLRIFAHVGQALEVVQCIEMDLVTLYLADSSYTGRAVVREQAVEMTEAWDEKTFGRLLKPLLSSPHIPTDMKIFLEQIRTKRNYLVHDYFKQNGHKIHNPDGRTAILAELTCILEELYTCRELINTSLRDFAREVGIADDAIEAERRRLRIPDGWAID